MNTIKAQGQGPLYYIRHIDKEVNIVPEAVLVWPVVRYISDTG